MLFTARKRTYRIIIAASILALVITPFLGIAVAFACGNGGGSGGGC